MKILYVIGAYGPHYIANEIHRELLLEFSRRGHQCIVYAGVTPGELHGESVSYRDGPIDVQRTLCDTRGKDYVAAELGRRLLHYPRFLLLLRGLRRLLAAHPDIDVIHADAVYPIGAIVALAARNHRAAIIPSIHGGDLISYPGYGYGRYRTARQLLRWTFGRSVAVRVNSPLMAARARELGCPAHKLQHVLVNIGDRFFEDRLRLAERRAEARAAVAAVHGFDPAAPLLLSTGRLLPLKGFPDLLEAVARLRQTRPELRLIIAGPNFVDPGLGDQRAALLDMIGTLGISEQVLLRDSLQHETEMPQYLLAADLLLAVARIEGMNRVVPEAGALGTPAIVSEMTGVASTVAHDQAGMVVPASDPPAIAAAIKQLLGSPELRAQHSARARRMAQRFRSATIADQLLALYGAGLTAHRQGLQYVAG